MSVKSFRKEINNKKRFKFGRNWKQFLVFLNEDRIKAAEESLKEMLKLDSLEGKSFLDIGSGSGLFSLAAKNLGADVVSFDFDETSVACTNDLKNRYYKNSNSWKVLHGSILDKEFLLSLGSFDIVYSWGVLHHTGSMWEALEIIAGSIRKEGMMFIALYNYQPFSSAYWAFVKKNYNRFPITRPLFIIIHSLYPLLPSILLKMLTRRKVQRGMTYWFDLLDWLGGYPFETSTPEEVCDFYLRKNFVITKLRTVNGKLGCNEYVFRKIG